MRDQGRGTNNEPVPCSLFPVPLETGQAAIHLRRGRWWRWGLLALVLAGVILQPEPSPRASPAARQASGALPRALPWTHLARERPLGRGPTPSSIQREDLWYGIYLGQSKIGYESISLYPDLYQDHEVQAARSYSVTRIGALGITLEQTIRVRQLFDEQGSPLYLEYLAESGGATQRVTAEFLPDRIRCRVDLGSGETLKSVPIPAGVTLLDPDFSPQLRDIPPGTRRRFHYFEPIGLAIHEGFVEAVGEEDATVDGRTVRLRKVQYETIAGEMTAWLDEERRPVRIDAVLGLRMVLEPAAKARSSDSDGAYGPTPDLAVTAAVRSTGVRILSPRNLRELTVHLTGVPKRELLIADQRQALADPPQAAAHGSFSAMMRITTEPAPAQAAPVPVQGASEEDLKASQHIDADNPNIVAQARRIAPGAADAFQCARAIARWVNDHMTAGGEVGLLRPASSVLKTQSGVCRDYAALYAALARARGIPSRLVAGVVYWDDGFYYHAWAESFVGEWVAFDPTQAPGYPVDATHIKFAQGDAISMLDVVQIMGKIGIEVMKR